MLPLQTVSERADKLNFTLPITTACTVANWSINTPGTIGWCHTEKLEVF